MGRRSSSPPISLFSFQDIITSVTGIMILVTLMLGLELIQRTVNAPPQKTAEITTAMETAVENVVEEIEDLKQQLAATQQDVMELAGIDPEDLIRELKELEVVNRRLKEDVTESERQSTEADRRKKEAEAEKARRKNDPRTLEEMTRETRRIEEELRKLKQSNRVIFNPAAGSAKQPWLVELSDRGFTVAEVGKVQPPSKFADLNAFHSWASKRDATNEYFVLLIKPTGVDSFPQITALLQQLKFDLGYDLLTANQIAIDPETGAGIK